MAQAQHSSAPAAFALGPSLGRPFYPVPLTDYVVKPREVVRIAGQPLIRTTDGRWLLVDHADHFVRETDD